MITAEQAKELTIKGKAKAIENQLIDITVDITDAANEGRNSVVIDNYLYTENIAELKKQGFKVTLRGKWSYYGSYYEISWE